MWKLLGVIFDSIRTISGHWGVGFGAIFLDRLDLTTALLFVLYFQLQGIVNIGQNYIAKA
jgi:hypothetical protein